MRIKEKIRNNTLTKSEAISMIKAKLLVNPWDAKILNRLAKWVKNYKPNRAEVVKPKKKRAKKHSKKEPNLMWWKDV